MTTPSTTVTTPAQRPPLPVERLAMLAGWAMVRRSAGYVWPAERLADISAALDLARQSGRTLVPRGAGYSYGDAALNAEDLVLDLTRMRNILAWDAGTGVITVEPGVTFRDLWRATLPDGFWPAVTPGTMRPTIGGGVAMNVHGKNAWRAGPIAEHLLSFDLLTSDGTLRTVTPAGDPDLFHAVTGGLGMLGIVTSATLQMRPVVSGRLRARQIAARNLAEMFAVFAAETPSADFLVGWIDGFARGPHLGRGLVERGDFSAAPEPATLRPEAQDLPPRIAGIVPRSQLWRALRPVFNDAGMRAANLAQLQMGARRGAHEQLVPHAQFHYLHDYLPNWKRAWLPGGLRQFQVFVPTDQAPDVFAELLARSQRAGCVPYLCVFKQHRADAALLSYQVDGFSLSLDYHVTARNAARLDALLRGMVTPVLQAGGRFYPAKDDALAPADFAQSVGPERLATFLALKRRLDPDGLFSSDLFRRVCGVGR